MRFTTQRRPCRSYITAIDPGIAGTGVAIWKTAKWKDRRVHLPDLAFNIWPKESFEWEQNIFHILKGLRAWIEISEEIHCEYQEVFQTAKGRSSSDSGKLQKLTMFTGALMEACHAQDTRFVLYEPTKWKGQLSKEQVIYRLQDIYPKGSLNGFVSHAFDAIGIGLFAQGKFHR